ncbi:hypothetical protein EDD18DRAFT_636439 [Armillaria luteobubalina]|uniref:Uncharacterized protein n=1 Tax=Armillaria luteobubalina TaxID=153913 RepID=A0AA39QJN6_9AGAR|nr:hypothetical protein EDD18DRAFT_636439 [Armillaria luteobubalina]
MLNNSRSQRKGCSILLHILTGMSNFGVLYNWLSPPWVPRLFRFYSGISIPRGFHNLYLLLHCTRRLLLNSPSHTHKNGILLPDTDIKRCAFFVYEALSPPSAATKASSKLYGIDTLSDLNITGRLSLVYLASTMFQYAQHSRLQTPSVVGRPRLRYSEIQGAHLVHEGYFLNGLSWKMR